jgi:hypothetical protein
MLRALALKLLPNALLIAFSLPTSPVVRASAVSINQYDLERNLKDGMSGSSNRMELARCP